MIRYSCPLPNADWCDRFEADYARGGLSAVEAASRLLAHPPRWVLRLMRLRNRITALAGLRSVDMALGNAIGGFPILMSMPERVVLGFDDRHLDFRIVVDVRSVSGETGQKVAVTTLVHRRNAFGRFYLACVTPFHRRIVPATMAAFLSGIRAVPMKNAIELASFR